MKLLIILIGLAITLTCNGQVDLILEEHLEPQEYECLNTNLNREIYTFDFKDKKVAFFSSPGGTVLQSKTNFFRIEDGVINADPHFDIVIFTEKQKREHGYDVAVIYESKNSKPRVSNKLKRLVRKKN